MTTSTLPSLAPHVTATNAENREAPWVFTVKTSDPPTIFALTSVAGAKTLVVEGSANAAPDAVGGSIVTVAVSPDIVAVPRIDSATPGHFGGGGIGSTTSYELQLGVPTSAPVTASNRRM